MKITSARDGGVPRSKARHEEDRPGGNTWTRIWTPLKRETGETLPRGGNVVKAHNEQLPFTVNKFRGRGPLKFDEPVNAGSGERGGQKSSGTY